MSAATWWGYQGARELDLTRLCACVHLDYDEDGFGWIAERDCRGCLGRGLRHRDAVRIPRTPEALREWSERGAITLTEYSEVLRYERRVAELEALRAEYEDDDATAFWRLLRVRRAA